MKVLLKRFHLNGNTIEFRSQTQKLEPHYKISLVILVVWVHSCEFLVTKAVNQKCLYNKMIPDVFYFIFLVKETDSYVQTWPTIRLEQWTFDLKSLWCVSFFVSTCVTLQPIKGHAQMNLVHWYRMAYHLSLCYWNDTWASHLIWQLSVNDSFSYHLIQPGAPLKILMVHSGLCCLRHRRN